VSKWGLGLVVLVWTISSYGFRGGAPDLVHDSVVAFEGRGVWCVGTWLLHPPGEEDILATAAHCLDNFTTGGIQILRGIGTGARSIGVFVHSNAGTPDSVDTSHDFALAYFDSGTAGGRGVGIAVQPAMTRNGVTPVTWEPFAQGRLSAPNEILNFNYHRNGIDRTGYIIHEDAGGLPDQQGESGAPLLNSQGELLGVLRGCGQDHLANIKGIMKTGWSCFYSATASKMSLEMLAAAKQDKPGPLGSVDVNSLVSLGTVGTTPGANPVVVATNPPPPGTPAPTTQTPQPAATQVTQVSPAPVVAPTPPQPSVPVVMGPPLAAVSPLATLTQSPRGNEVTDLEVTATPVKKRKLAEVEEPPLPGWLEDLLLEDRDARSHSGRTVPKKDLEENLAEAEADERGPRNRKAPAKTGKSVADDLSEDLE